MKYNGGQKGFLLIELMVAMTIGLFLFGIGVFWKKAILDLYQETHLRLDALKKIHQKLGEIITNKQFAKGNWQNEGVTLHLHPERVVVRGNHTNLPFIKDPTSFQLLSVEALWDHSKKPTKFITGVLSE